MQGKVVNDFSAAAVTYAGLFDLNLRPQPTAVVRLPDGRDLAYDEYGSNTGFPVFYFHDSGSSRLEGAFFHKSSLQQNIRVIAVDRPGIGCSDYRHKASAAEFAADVSYLASQLGIVRFGLMSIGSGGVFALTMAYLYPDQVSIHMCFAGIPHNVFSDRPTANANYFDTCLRGILPPAIRLSIRLRYNLLQENPERYWQRLYQLSGYADRKTLANPRIRKILESGQQESFRQGSTGVAQDTATGFRKLTFQLDQVKVPVLIWQGTADNLSSRSECEFMASRLPTGSYHRVTNQGHFFFVSCMNHVYSRAQSFMFD